MSRSTSSKGVALGAIALMGALIFAASSASAQVVTAEAALPLSGHRPALMPAESLLSENLVASAVKSESMMIDPFLTPANHTATFTGATPTPPPRLPINWISGPNIKAGVAMMTGESILESADAGYTISGGVRQPLMPALDERLFFDLGGSFLSVNGSRSVLTDAVRSTTDVNDPTNPFDDTVSQELVDDAYRSELEELLRGTVHASLGWYWGDPLDSRADDPQWRLATRFGGRLGHMHGEFQDHLIAAPPAANESYGRRMYNTNDTIGGLFVGTEFIILNRDWMGGSVQWTLDAEFANDWVTFKGWDSGTLGTASIMLGVMFAR